MHTLTLKNLFRKRKLFKAVSACIQNVNVFPSQFKILSIRTSALLTCDV